MAAGPALGQEGLDKRARRQLELGDARYARGEYGEAAHHYEKAKYVAAEPSFDILIRLIRANFALGQYKTTVALADEARTLATAPAEHAELAFFAGRSYMESAYLAGATVKGEELVELWEQSMETAESFLLNAAATAPEASPESRYWLGRIYEERRELDHAERFYHDYQVLAPDGEYAESVDTRLELLRTERADPVDVDDDIIPPVPIYRPPPQYTWEARQARIEGVVIVKAIIDRTGEVTSLELLKGLPMGGLDQSALAAIRRWRFKPARRQNGQPIAVYYTLTVRFALS